MKTLLAALLSFCLIGTLGSGISRAESSTVIIFGTVKDSKAGVAVNYPYCSGVLMGTSNGFDVVITARHCIVPSDDGEDRMDPTPTAVKFSDGRRYKVYASAVSLNDDLGFLLVATTNHPAIDLSRTPISRGETYFSFGMPNGNPWSYSLAYAPQGDKNSDVPNSAPIWKYTRLYVCSGCGPGDSGGGMYTQDGELVGITVSGGGNYTLAVPVERIQQAYQHMVLYKVYP